ncbi:L-type lectin-domain containing receptor kinase VIII.1 [Hibiscus syriacus]|uniref:non-specific serine/threonine protein kinase n=1 Tax=Hibiscus syriacus TaxID=106335 RepID=A0A6A3BNH6_HIBSY|nr:L-type lectin-domain containing receptor kinase VIII.1 [Hibiscus syriacus]
MFPRKRSDESVKFDVNTSVSEPKSHNVAVFLQGYIHRIGSVHLFCPTLHRNLRGDGVRFRHLNSHSLKLLGDAHLNNGSVRLTRDVVQLLDFFSFSVTNLNPSSIGGGLAFVISPDGEFVGAAGGSLGLLDDKRQAAVGDLGALDIDLKSGNLFNSWIEYDAPSGVFNITVSYSNLKPKEPMLSFPLNLGQSVNDFMYVGFSGSTQGSTEVHSIEWWSFSSSFQSTSPAPPPPPKATLLNQRLTLLSPGAVAGVVTAGAFVFALFAGGLIWVFSKKFKHVEKSSHFHRRLSKCRKSILPNNGDIVAVKRCSHNSQGKTSSCRRLQGWSHEILLVYDLMPNGSLDKALFEARTPLPWPHRQKILLGVASALAYLHQECDHQVIHRDVKTSNIMLDEGFNAKIGDFGLARQIEHDRSPDTKVAAGTMGYLAPEYLQMGRATEKIDVFSYGAVALEVASGRRPIERDANVAAKAKVRGNLVEWVWSLHREGRLLNAADARLKGEFDEGEMRRVLLVGLACSHPDPLIRPTMRSVVQILVGEAEVPMVPRAKPLMSFSTSNLLLSLQDSESDCNGMTTLSSSSSESSHIGPDLV